MAKNWKLIGGIAVGVIVVAGITNAVSGENTTSPTAGPTTTIASATPIEVVSTPAPEPEPVDAAAAAAEQAASEFEGAAVTACGNVAETALKNAYPASKVKIHTIMGILANELREDGTRFVKLEASVDKNTLNVECTVSGSGYDAVATLDYVY